MHAQSFDSYYDFKSRVFKHIIIEYSYCKMPRNSPLNENEKGQISAYKLEVSLQENCFEGPEQL